MRAAITAIVAVGLAASACGGSSGSSASSGGSRAAGAGEQAVTIRATDTFRFEPATVEVHPGPVRITLVDAGSYPHNLSFPSLHRTSATVTGSLGEQRTTLLLDAKAGTYSFICTFHSSAGMRGTLVVR